MHALDEDGTSDGEPRERAQRIARAASELQLRIVREQAIADGQPPDFGPVLDLRGVAASADDLDHHELCEQLIDGIGPTLTQALIMSPSVGVTHGSANQEPAVLRRLRAAAAAWCALNESDGPDVARLWMIGSNPWLHGQTPLDALLSDQFDDVEVAWRAYSDDSWAG